MVNVPSDFKVHYLKTFVLVTSEVFLFILYYFYMSYSDT